MKIRSFANFLGDLCNFSVFTGNNSNHFSTQRSWFEEAAELLVNITERAPSSTQHLWTEMITYLPIGKKACAFAQSLQLQLNTSTWLQLSSTKKLLASFCCKKGRPVEGGEFWCVVLWAKRTCLKPLLLSVHACLAPDSKFLSCTSLLSPLCSEWRTFVISRPRKWGILISQL